MAQQYIFSLPVLQDWQPSFNSEVTVWYGQHTSLGQLDSPHAPTQ